MTPEPSNAEILAALGGAPAKRGRGRPKGSTNKEPRRPRAADFDARTWIAAHCSFLCDPRGNVFLGTDYKGHFQWHPILSDLSRYALVDAGLEATGAHLGAAAVEAILKHAEGAARVSGPYGSPSIRVGWDRGDILIDLGSHAFDMVRVSRSGFKIEPIGRFPFYRPLGFGALPVPEPEGNLADARMLLNTESEADFTLIMSWLVSSLRPGGPYVFLNLGGEQGSGKSTMARMLRGLVDPNDTPIRTQPREIDDVVVAAMNNHVLGFDNTARFEEWLSNVFCVMATGGGIVSRKLYTDAAEAGFNGMRPIINSAITNVLTAPDLAQRAYMVRLRRIEEHERRPETEVWDTWRAFEPRMFGILCDGLSSAIRRYPEVVKEGHRLPRMADAALWSVAAERGLGIEDGSVLAALQENQDMALAETFENDPVAMAIHELLPKEGERWSGTMAGLLARLETTTPENIRKSHAWPKTPQAMTAKLDRIKPVLRSHGLDFHKARGDVRNLVLERVRTTPEAPKAEPEGKAR